MEHDGTPFVARLVKFEGQKLDRLSLGDEGVAMAPRRRSRRPISASRTSTCGPRGAILAAVHHLDPATGSARKLGFSASHTMRVAQTLYEAGAITYMRTDGVQMDPSAIDAARRAISDRYNGHFLPEKPRVYETKAKNAQEAHEAIRPTDFTRDTHGSGDERGSTT
jgi:DNA topoisomerase-1